MMKLCACKVQKKRIAFVNWNYFLKRCAKKKDDSSRLQQHGKNSSCSYQIRHTSPYPLAVQNRASLIEKKAQNHRSILNQSLTGNYYKCTNGWKRTQPQMYQAVVFGIWKVLLSSCKWRWRCGCFKQWQRKDTYLLFHPTSYESKPYLILDFSLVLRKARYIVFPKKTTMICTLLERPKFHSSHNTQDKH